jgi:SM-20-related protein
MQRIPPNLATSPDPTYAKVATQLLHQGWCVYPDFLPAEAEIALREQALVAWQTDRFRHAGIGRGSSFEIKPQIRCDRVMWLEQATADEAIATYFAALETLRLSINRELYLGLYDYEAHFAVYPPGSFYKKHLDQFRGIGLRTVTTTFYLNDNWLPQHGGQLRLYTNATAPEEFVDILPESGTLVAFLSAEFLHEVLPARRERFSITGWFRRREP